MIGETPTGNHFGCSGIIVSALVMIFMWFGLSYLSASAVNWFVNVRCSEMMKSAGGWNWKKCLEWILVDREKGGWSWFRSHFKTYLTQS